jgi:hypothetical protein
MSRFPEPSWIGSLACPIRVCRYQSCWQTEQEAPGIYLESFKVDSWAEHERQHNRFTQADREIEKQVLSYALQPVEVKHYIYAP